MVGRKVGKSVSVDLKKHGRSDDVENAQNRRKALLEAAKKCFCTIGFHQTTMRDIAKAAGISVGHIYNSFASKEEIVEAMAIQQTEEFSQMLLEDECEPDDLKGVEEHFRRVVKAMFDPESAYLVVSFMNEAFTNERLHNLAVTLMKNFREQVLDICKSERPFSREEMEAQVVFMLSVFQGLRFMMQFHPNLSKKVVTDVVVDRLMLIIRHDIEQPRQLEPEKSQGKMNKAVASKK